MSPNNPGKLRPVRPLITVLAVGEGETEGAFLTYLKSIYGSRGSGIQIKVDWTYGGSPGDIINEALRMKKGASYSRAFLIMDTDVQWPKEEVESAHESNLILIGSQQCLESVFLQILDPSIDWSRRSTKECKQEFHTKYLDRNQKLDSSKYGKHFDRATLDTAKLRVQILGEIIRHLTTI